MNYLKLHVNPKKADVDLALCRRIIKEIRKHPRGVSQQNVLLKVVKGYRGSDNSASYTKEFRHVEDMGFTYAHRIQVKKSGGGRSKRECQRVVKWYPDEYAIPPRKREKIKDFLNIHVGIQI